MVRHSHFVQGSWASLAWTRFRARYNWFMPKAALNTPAPNFELEDLNGRLFKLSDHRGQKLLLVLNRGFT